MRVYSKPFRMLFFLCSRSSRSSFSAIFSQSITLSPKPPISFHRIPHLSLHPFSFSSLSSPPSPESCESLIPLQNNAEMCIEILKNYGCTEIDVSKILDRHPSLLKAKIPFLESKLQILQRLGLPVSDLVKILACRAKFLAVKVKEGLDHRIQYLENLFGSKETLLRALLQNPSLLNYDVDQKLKPCIAMYENMGISRPDLVSLIITRPMIMLHSSLTPEKLDYLKKSGLSKESKMYKYVLSLLAVSRIETVRLKIANFEKFGFSMEEVMGLIGKSPYVLTLSVDKVQRNMTYVVATMKLPAKLIMDNPVLVHANLERVIRPRFILLKKIKAMRLMPQIEGPMMLTALRMTEKRFLQAFVNCHAEDVAQDLLDAYRMAKGLKRLAEASKLPDHKGLLF
ncbi:uncharacterized protein LOC18430029 [Amborella trichopoda]|nr:uncharacterized protein LOC18430029 [Amborella trichopoda]|eukprot:XP_006840259.2 uncharacterized protein LOC18430029 [Amborella trichopoda]